MYRIMICKFSQKRGLLALQKMNKIFVDNQNTNIYFGCQTLKSLLCFTS